MTKADDVGESIKQALREILRGNNKAWEDYGKDFDEWVKEETDD